jgi:hypothetical protein
VDTQHYDLYWYDGHTHTWEFVTTYKVTQDLDHFTAINSMRTNMIEHSELASVLFDAVRSELGDWRGYKWRVYRSRDQHTYTVNPNSVYPHGQAQDTVGFQITEKHDTHGTDVLIIQPDYAVHALYRACRWIA